jgi:hypothetical protein
MVISSGHMYLTHRKNCTDSKKPEDRAGGSNSVSTEGWMKRLYSRYKYILSEHKLIAVAIYSVIHFGGWGTLYLAFVNNVLDVSLIGADQIEVVTNMADSAAKYMGVSTNFTELVSTDYRYKCGALSMVANGFMEPLKIAGVVTFTPGVAKYMRKKSSPPPPPPPLS